MAYDILEVCTQCGTFYSYLQDRETGNRKWVEGNFILGSNEKIYILSGNEKEAQVARAILSTWCNIKPEKIVYLRDELSIRDIRQPKIYFYGTWYEREDILGNTVLAGKLNQRL